MRIALVTETFLPSTDGVVTRLTQACHYLVSQGHELLILCPDLGVSDFEGQKVIGMRAVTFPFYKSRPWALPSTKVKKILQEFKPDVVHAANPMLLAASGIKYANELDIPLLASYHTHIPKYLEYYHAEKHLKPLVWKYIIDTHNKADINLCTSEAMYEELSEHGMERLHVLRRGVDVDHFHPGKANAEMRIRLTQGHPERRLLIFVGRIALEKQLDRIRGLFDARPDLAIAFVGDGPEWDQIQEIYAGTHAVFTGPLHGEELAQAYASADAFIFPSQSETLGLVILEGMASGLPVIAADSAPTREQLTDGVDGLIFKQSDLNTLVSAIDRLDDSEFRQQLSHNARLEAQKYSWTSASAELFDYYQDAIAVHASAREDAKVNALS